MSSEKPSPYQKAGWENETFPVGGGRVPEGMKDHANWMDLPEQPVVPTRGEDISPAYVAAENKRNAFGELKKQLALLTPAVASIYKNHATRSNTKPDDEEKLKFIDSLIEQQAKLRDDLVAHLRTFQQKDGLRPDENEFGAALDKILNTVPASDCFVQEEHTKWNDATKMLSQKLFREQSVFLAQMKAEKKKKLDAEKNNA